MKYLSAMVLFVGFTSNALGQAPSNNCSTNAANEYPVTSSCTPIAMNSSNNSNSLPAGSGCGAANLDDAWAWFTAPSNSTTVTYNPTNRNAILNVYSGTCGALTQVGCANAGGNGVAETVTFVSTPGATYFVRIQRSGSNNNMGGSLCVVDNNPVASPGDTECAAIQETVGSSCSFTTYDNAGMTTSGSAPAPGCANFVNADMWFVVEVPASGTLEFETSAGTMTDGGLAIYSGTNCSPLTLLACDDDGGTGFMSLISASGLTPGDSIYIRVWEYGGGTGTFGLCVWEACGAGAPANNTPCTATSVVPGGSAVGEDNACADGTDDPASPICFTAGASNALWYQIVAPSSGNLLIGISNGTITGTQVAIFSGACGALVEEGCSRTSSAGCSATPLYDSDLILTGLTPGATYFISIDGQNSTTGTYDVFFIDGGTVPIPAQDCTSPIPICNTNMNIGNPGYNGTGNVCDFDGSQDCTGGERNSVWYQIDILAPGFFNFTLTPNDGGPASCGAETDYDFVMWRTVAGNGTDPVESCGTLSSSSAGLVACNYDFRGLTGIAAGGNAPVGINACFDLAFEPTLTVVGGDRYILVIQNFSGSTQGFNLDFSGSGVGVIDYTGVPSVVGWTGGTDTNWDDSGNWGSCLIPSCGIDAVVIGGIANQPILTGSHSVKTLTINAGATLTLNAGATLNVCGDFVNNGNIVADPTSTILVNGILVDQNFSGSLTGANTLGNFVVNKTSNTVFVNTPIECSGNFTTSTLTSLIDANDNDLTFGGDVTLAGPGTLTDVDDGLVTFDGTAPQSWTTNGDLSLNNIIMNGVQVDMNDNVISDADGVVTLTNGIFVTGGNRVETNNTNSAAINAGSVASYVLGNVRRYVTGSTAYDFPVGEAIGGYQRANVSFTTATTINYLDGRFDPWSGAPPAGLGANECIAANYNIGALDNGFFTINASNTPTSGDYDMVLYNTAGTFTNSGAASGWTVMKNSGTGWALDGTCDPASTVTQVGRFGLNGFSMFATAQNGGTSPLPVTLIEFKGERTGSDNLISWITATELNSSHFEVERSTDGANFEKIGSVLAANNSTFAHFYQFIDINQPKAAYYRLRAVDINSDFEFSDLIWVEAQQSDGNELLVYPNPATNQLSIVTGNFESDASLRVYDITGKLVLQEKVTDDLSGLYRLNFEAFEAGNYFIRFINGTQVKTATVSKK